MTFSFKKTLIAALILVLAAGLIAPERVFAQGITGMVEYTVLSGQKLTVYSQPVADPAYELGGIEAGTHRAPGAQLSGGWYRLDNTNGTTWYFIADPSVVTVKFTEDSAPTDEGGNGNQVPGGGGTTNVDLSRNIQLDSLKGVPTTLLVIMFLLVLVTLLTNIFLGLAESVKDKRFPLIGWLVFWLGLTAVMVGILAVINATKGETCAEGIVCISKSPAGYAMTGIVSIMLLVAVISLLFVGRRKMQPMHASESGATMEIKEMPAAFNKKFEQAVADGYVPRGDPIPMADKDEGKIYVSMIKLQEAHHREMQPTAIFVGLIADTLLLFGLFGYAYLGPLHFKVITDLKNGISLASIPVLYIAFVPLLFYLVEMLVENAKRLWLPGLMIVGWVVSWFAPWPPLLSLAIMHGLSALADGGGKNFWRGHSDAITFSLRLGLTMFILGAPWVYSTMGGFWLDHTTWLNSWSSAGGQWLIGLLP